MSVQFTSNINLKKNFMNPRPCFQYQTYLKDLWQMYALSDVPAPSSHFLPFTAIPR